MDERAQNQMTMLMKRVSNIFGMVSLMIDGEPDESADKLFTAFLLTQLAQERGLLGDNCNRAVTEALHAVGLEEETAPIYLQEKGA
ncbi:hypothetical protein LCGC14_2497310 [marine sediment metagenome]|uniref:Uncharacterized protein n=1 Tax=marine sediment metagenome TaxID=412755 RepID=A0A0F9B2X9_9ZZZZ